MKKILLLLVAVFVIFNASGQSSSCNTAVQVSLMPGLPIVYPASTNVPSPSYGAYPNFGCLCVMQNPAWFFIQIGIAGNIDIHIATTPAHDVDFICWGPFSSLTSVCTNYLTGSCLSCGPTGCPNNTTSPNFYPSGNITDCSYDAAVTENCHINNALTGQYYIFMITNYSNIACNIIFNQSNYGQVGAGSTNDSALSIPTIYTGHCTGDSIKLHADTIMGATYNWHGPNSYTSTLPNPIILNATPSMSGDYICWVMQNNNVVAMDTVHAIIHPIPYITVASDTICLGDTVTLTASGAIQYGWSNNSTSNHIVVSPQVTTMYSLYGIDSNNCIGYSNTKVTVLNTIPVITLNGNVLTSSSATGNQWMLNGIPISGDTSQSYTLPTPNIDTAYYSVRVTDSHGCTALSNIITILPVGINELATNNSVLIYPNPIKNKLTIETNSNTKQCFEILNNVGQTVYTSYIYKKTTVNTTAFAKGVYIIKLNTAKETIVKKFVKE